MAQTIEPPGALKTKPEFAPPPALTGFKLYLPAGLGYSSPTLGLPVCKANILEASGAESCPSGSRIGTGIVRIFSGFIDGGTQLPELTAFTGPPHKGHPSVLIDADGTEPPLHLVLDGELLPASGASGAQLDIPFPPMPVVPGGPLRPVTSFALTLGTTKQTLTRRVHHKLVRYHPRGISVPRTCPDGGFPFLAQLTFQDGENAEASTTIPCPPRKRVR